MSDNISNESWPMWKFALYVGVPVGLITAGAYYYITKSSKESLSDKTSRAEPEGKESTMSPTKADNSVIVDMKEHEEEPQQVIKPPLEESQDLKNEGNKFFKQGMYNEAIEKYTAAIGLCPDDAKTEKSTYHQNKAAAYEKQENWQAVIEECSLAIDLNSKYVKALYRRSKAYEKIDERENCLEDITTVCILEGFQNATSMSYADDMLKKIGKQKAEENYKTRQPKMPSVIFIKQYFTSFNCDVISNKLTDEEWDLAPSNGYIRAKIAFEEERFSDVIIECTLEIESHETEQLAEGDSGDQVVKQSYDYLAKSLLLRGSFYLLTGQNILARSDLDTVIDMETADQRLRANALIKRGSMNMQQQDGNAAESDFQKAVEISPENCDVFHHRGQLHILLDKIDNALADFNQCIEINPDFALAHAQRCYTKYRQAMTRQDIVQAELATTEFQEIIKRYPKCSETYGLYAQAQTDRANFQAADELFKKSIEIEPDNATLYVHRGMLALQWRQDVEEAVKLINSALLVDPKCDFAHETMGTIEVQRGNLSKACEHFQVAIDFAKSEMEMAHLYALQAAAVAQGNIAMKYGLRPSIPPGVGAHLP